jgi:hypothetical protein
VMEPNMDDDENLVSKEFPELFHYTTVSAFESIYKTPQQFRATHYEDLNDSSEFTRFRLKVRDFIRPKIWEIFDKKVRCSAEIAKDVSKQGGIDFVVNKEAEWLLDEVHRHTFGKQMYKDTFFSSFCAHNISSYEARHGLLSQWRGYGAAGGVAIVLDTSGVEKMLHHDSQVFQLQIIIMGTVIYDNDSNDVRIKKIFKDVFKYFPKILEEIYPEKGLCNEKGLESYFEKIHDHFLLGSIRVKHDAFHEENEIRIVVSPRTKDSFSYNLEDSKRQKKFRYRQIGNCEARYIELFGDAPLPIKRIIVGPSRTQNFNYQRIREIVDKNSRIDVVNSEIPFLG